MRYYENQAFAVEVMLNDLIKKDEQLGTNSSESIACLRDAITTLNALALIGEATVLRAQALERIAKELVMEVLTDGRELSFAEVLQYANDFNKVLNPVNIIQDEQLQN